MRTRAQLLMRHLGVFVLYTLLACITLYWLLFHARTHVGGARLNDYFHFHWNYWWIRHALSVRGLRVYETNFVLFPYTTNLAYHTLVPFWFPLWSLLEPRFGTLIAMDAVMVAALAASGYTLFALLRWHGVAAGLALVGGALFQLTPSLFRAALMTHLNYLSFFWLPTALLTWGALAQHVTHAEHHTVRGVLGALGMGAIFYGMLLTDYALLVYSVLLLFPYGLLTLARADRPARARLVALGGLAVLSAVALGWLAGPLSYLLAFDRSALAPATPQGTHSIPFPRGFFWREPHGSDAITLGALAVPALLLSVLASVTVLRGRVRDRERWFWLAVALPPLVLAVGATVTLGGHTVRTPYYWVHGLLGNMFRRPDRFGTVFLIPALIFIGRTWSPLWRKARVRRWWAVVLLALVFADARLYAPIPIKPVAPAYDFYARIGAERGAPYDDYVVLEVPVAAGTGETWVGKFEQLVTQFYGMTHHKRMVNGLIARAPVSHYWYLRTDDPLLSWLGQRRPLQPETAAEELRRLIYEWPIGYVVVHQDLIGATEPANQEILGFFNAHDELLCPVWVERDAIVYRTAWHPLECPPRRPQEVAPGTYRIDIGTPNDRRFLGWGWHWAEDVAGFSVRWTGDMYQTVFALAQNAPKLCPLPEHNASECPAAQLFVDLPPDNYTLTLNAQAFERPRPLTLWVNGERIATMTVPDGGLTSLLFNISAAVIGDGRHVTITLGYDGTSVPPQLQGEPNARRLGLMVESVQFQRLSPQQFTRRTFDFR